MVQGLRLHSQCRGPMFDPWTEKKVPHATTKKTLHAAMKMKILCAATKTHRAKIINKQGYRR